MTTKRSQRAAEGKVQAAKQETARPGSTPRMAEQGGRPYLIAGKSARAVTAIGLEHACLGVPLPQEGEDAHITGMTRSLFRRLLALNMAGSLQAQRIGKVVGASALSGSKELIA